VGDKVLVAEHTGPTHEAVVGRVKIERRPPSSTLPSTLSPTARTATDTGVPSSRTSRIVSAFWRTRLTFASPAFASTRRSGRHFGVAVKETILEK
jgi:3-dehydroquinate synthase II